MTDHSATFLPGQEVYVHNDATDLGGSAGVVLQHGDKHAPVLIQFPSGRAWFNPDDLTGMPE